MWTKDELNDFNQTITLQNRPYGDDNKPVEDNPVWCVVVNGRLFIRGAKGDKDTGWIIAGTKNGGQVALDGHEYSVKYKLISDQATIDQVTEAYEKKYHGQYPIDMMVGATATTGTIELIKE